jgi:NADH-quinone oxidoreductase subunit M
LPPGDGRPEEGIFHFTDPSLHGGVRILISLDLFTMFLFYEVAVIPMYILIGIWGSGPKEYSAMKLTLMLMGGSALLMVGLFGIYFNSAPDGGELTFNILEISKITIPIEAQRWFFPFTFVGFGVLGLFSLFIHGHLTVTHPPYSRVMLHAGVLMKLGGYGAFRVAMFLMPEAATEMAWIFIILTTISVVYGAFGAIVQKDLKYINAYSSVSHCGMVLFAVLMMNRDSDDRGCDTDDLTRTYDGTLLCAHRHDLRKDTHKDDQRDGRSDEGYPLPGCGLCYCRSCIPRSAGSQRIRCRDEYFLRRF